MQELSDLCGGQVLIVVQIQCGPVLLRQGTQSLQSFVRLRVGERSIVFLQGQFPPPCPLQLIPTDIFRGGDEPGTFMVVA